MQTPSLTSALVWCNPGPESDRRPALKDKYRRSRHPQPYPLLLLNLNLINQ